MEKETGNHFKHEQELKTFDDAAVLWMKSKKNRVKESTFAVYYLTVKSHLLPELGHLKLDEITEEGVNEYLDDLINRDRLRGGRRAFVEDGIRYPEHIAYDSGNCVSKRVPAPGGDTAGASSHQTIFDAGPDSRRAKPARQLSDGAPDTNESWYSSIIILRTQDWRSLRTSLG